tara:strand:+ start:462 stop:860 length:399 start_codon:yes stop_codon:yes gene_type:complete
MKLEITKKKIQCELIQRDTYTIKIKSYQNDGDYSDTEFIEGLNEKDALAHCELLQQIQDSGYDQNDSISDVFVLIDFNMDRVDDDNLGNYEKFEMFWDAYIGTWEYNTRMLEDVSVEYINKDRDTYQVDIKK